MQRGVKEEKLVWADIRGKRFFAALVRSFRFDPQVIFFGLCVAGGALVIRDSSESMYLTQCALSTWRSRNRTHFR